MKQTKINYIPKIASLNLQRILMMLKITLLKTNKKKVLWIRTKKIWNFWRKTVFKSQINMKMFLMIQPQEIRLMLSVLAKQIHLEEHKRRNRSRS